MLKPKPLPPDYSPPTFDNLGYEGNWVSGQFTGTPDVMTSQQANEQTPPPAYDVIFNARVEPIPTPISKNRDHRNLWDKCHELFENSILQQLIWLGALVFAIFYIYTGLVYTGKCRKYSLNKKNEVVSYEDITVWMKTEGGVFCTLVLFVFLMRVLILIDRRRTKRIGRSEMAGRKKWQALLFFMFIILCFASFGVCIAGAGKIWDVSNSTSKVKNQTRQNIVACDKSFHEIYYSTKIGQVVVFACYAAYLVLGLFFAFPISKKCYMSRKVRFFAYLLDADQDGVITKNDMRKTYAKLELIRRTIGDRGDPVQEDKQLEFFNKYIFKLEPNKDITVEEYASYLNGIFEPGPSMEKNMRPLVTDLFNAFSTSQYRKKETIIAYEDFARFWDILGGVDPRHCKKIFIRDFLNPTTMASLLEDFVNFLSKDDFNDPDSLRVFLLLKPSYEPDATIERICHPSCCNV